MLILEYMIQQQLVDIFTIDITKDHKKNIDHTATLYTDTLFTNKNWSSI